MKSAQISNKISPKLNLNANHLTDSQILLHSYHHHSPFIQKVKENI